MKKLILTNHAKKRIEEQRLSSEVIIKKAFQGAKRVKVSYGRNVYKNIRYPNIQDNIEYYYAKKMLYTVNKEDDYYVLITITKRDKKGLKFIK